MMRRRKIPANLWLMLLLPVLGAVGWGFSRLLGSLKIHARERKSNSGQRLAMDISSSQAQMQTRGNASVQRPAKDDETAVSYFDEPVDGVHPPPTEHAGRLGHAPDNRPEGLPFFIVLLVPFLILPVAIVMLALHHIPVQSQTIVAGGDVNHGKVELQAWGCGSCHTIDGVTGANGKVGPELKGLSERSFIAGHLRNTPDNMMQWIMHPQQISPGVDMPDSAVPESVARDMAAYLYSIK